MRLEVGDEALQGSRHDEHVAVHAQHELPARLGQYEFFFGCAGVGVEGDVAVVWCALLERLEQLGRGGRRGGCRPQGVQTLSTVWVMVETSRPTQRNKRRRSRRRSPCRLSAFLGFWRGVATGIGYLFSGICAGLASAGAATQTAEFCLACEQRQVTPALSCTSRRSSSRRRVRTNPHARTDRNLHSAGSAPAPGAQGLQGRGGRREGCAHSLPTSLATGFRAALQLLDVQFRTGRKLGEDNQVAGMGLQFHGPDEIGTEHDVIPPGHGPRAAIRRERLDLAGGARLQDQGPRQP